MTYKLVVKVGDEITKTFKDDFECLSDVTQRIRERYAYYSHCDWEHIAPIELDDMDIRLSEQRIIINIDGVQYWEITQTN